MNERKERSRPARASAEPPRIAVEHVTPEVDAGRFPAKRVRGEVVEVGANIFKDGHDILRARVRYRRPGSASWETAPLAYDKDDDRWYGGFTVDAIGRWTFTVEGWTDAFGTLHRKLTTKADAGQEIRVELLEAAIPAAEAAKRMRFGEARKKVEAYAKLLGDEAQELTARLSAAISPELLALMEAHHPPGDLTPYARELPLYVDREAAAFAAWYEFFPRSASPEPGRHGTFADAERLLPRIAELGFDVVYLPPIHPIGHTFRKGRNNTLTPEPGDVGSPWAIGNEDGGHEAVAPELGTVADFERFVKRANELGLEIALDFALQCSPDHPWVKEHPDWFHIRPDGTIAYAENPPKKYQDIFPINFWTEDRENLWNACRDLLLLWVSRGVKTFRVDNPHTKPFSFWEWAIREVQDRHPEVVFLSEAFTRPNKLLYLAKLGFTQSYGYFTWKTRDWEIRQWLAEFLAPEVAEFHRGNFFANTPDILHEYLQTGGRAAFRVRLVLAATLSPLYGIYSGFELLEGTPVRPGSEEYMDSEKYELRPRDFSAPGNLDDEIRLLNRIRRAERALQRQENVEFLESENPNILFFRRAAVDRSADILVAANLDPHAPHHTMVTVPVADLGIGEDEPYEVEDLLSGARYTWRGARNYVRLDPAVQVAHVLRVAPRPRRGEVGGEVGA
jgi:starch synthase (maltosyl-transferring)